jgi:(2Fe-2S) ferredoxin
MQQGASSTIASLQQHAASTQGAVSIASTECIGMCGLGPCLSIRYLQSGVIALKGGIDSKDFAAIESMIAEAMAEPVVKRNAAADDYGEC